MKSIKKQVEEILIEVMDYAFDKGKRDCHNPNYEKAEKWASQLTSLLNKTLENMRLEKKMWPRDRVLGEAEIDYVRSNDKIYGYNQAISEMNKKIEELKVE